MMMAREIKGVHVLGMFVLGFGVIIAVNLTLAFNAVKTFPGLEVKNSYVASQSFDVRRNAQLALGWDVAARYEDGALRLNISDASGPVNPTELDGILGRATHVGDDIVPEFRFNGTDHVAVADLGPGNWNLRMKAVAADGTPFEQRVIVRVVKP